MKDILQEHVVKFIEDIKTADIVIGIPSYNNARTIEGVITNYAQGLKKYYPDCRSVIVNSDGGSKDNTVDIVNNCAIPPEIKKIATLYKGIPGKGSAFRTIFEIAERLGVRVCVVSDADTRSISPEWARSLVEPVLGNGFGYVNPYYSRDKHDGTITNGLIYPMTRMLYGMRIRQPIGGDFSFSNGLLQIFNKDAWWDNYPNINKFGIDIWMTTIALNEGFKVCQTMLGAKIHDDKDPGSHLADMFIQVVGTMFELIKYYEFHWKKVENSVQGEMFGKHKFFEIEKIDINTSELWNIFNKGLAKYRQIWKNIFTANTFSEFEKVADTIPSKNIHLSVELWARIVFEYASLYNFIDKSQKNALLISMLPLYFLRTASFIREAEHLNYEIADAIVEGDAGVFERLKYCFTDQWEYYKSKKEKISIDGLIE